MILAVQIAIAVLIFGPILAFGIANYYPRWRLRRQYRRQRADLRAVLPDRRWPT